MARMSARANDSDFYEDDEPVADVVAAFARGEKRVTQQRSAAARPGIAIRAMRFRTTVTRGQVVVGTRSAGVAASSR